MPKWSIQPDATLCIGNEVAEIKPESIVVDAKTKARYKIVRRLGGSFKSAVFVAIEQKSKGLIVLKRLVIDEKDRATQSPAVDQLEGELSLSRIINQRTNALFCDTNGVCAERIFIREGTVDPALEAWITFPYRNTVPLPEYCRDTLWPQLRKLREEGESVRAEFFVLSLFRQIMEALARLHAINMIHRDIKPANVVVNLDMAEDDGERLLPGFVQFIDFGISCTRPDSLFGALALDPADVCRRRYSTTPSYADPVSRGFVARSSEEAVRIFKFFDIYQCGLLLVFMMDADVSGGYQNRVLPRTVQKPYRPSGMSSITYAIVKEMTGNIVFRRTAFDYSFIADVVQESVRKTSDADKARDMKRPRTNE